MSSSQPWTRAGSSLSRRMGRPTARRGVAANVRTSLFGSVQADIYEEGSVIRISRVFVLLLFFSMNLPIVSRAQVPNSEKSFVVEYYYKAKWGHGDEFLKLF